jgi:hypothetical protein
MERSLIASGQPWKRRVAGLLLAGVMIALGPGSGAYAAETGPPSKPPAPAPVKVGVYLLNITDFDPRNGMFSADYYLDLRSAGVNPTKYELMNGTVLSKSDMSDGRPNIYLYRVRSRMLADMDFRRYPFDRHQLSISLEDELLNAQQLTYAVEPGKSGIDPAVRVPGWDLDPVWKGEVDGHHYDIYDDTYSRYNFRITISRQVLGVFVKSLLPALLVVLGGLSSLLLGADKIVNRLTVLTASQVASVVLHLNMTSAIPPVGYMTFADRFMVVNYLGLVGGIGLTALTVYFHERKREEKVALVSRLVPFVPLLWAILQFLNALSLALPD